MSVEQEQRATSPVANEIDNLLIFAQPMKQEADSGPWFVAGIGADPDHTLTVDLATALPPLWEGKYVQHFVPIAELRDVLFKAGYFDEEKISHLACLEAVNQPNKADPFYFNYQPVEQNSAIMWFSEATQTYRFIHCRKCAYALLTWLTEKQETWEKSAAPKAGRA